MHIILNHQYMFSGQEEAQNRKYNLYEDKYGVTWLVSDQLNAADNIYCSNKNNKPGEGFGGAKLKMPLVGGGEFILNGGWHSNADALFSHTGIDVRHTYLTLVIIGENRTYNTQHRTIITNVLYYETKPQLGIYDRYKNICGQALHQYNLDHVIYYMESKGGSSDGWFPHYEFGEYVPRIKYEDLDPAEIRNIDELRKEKS